MPRKILDKGIEGIIDEVLTISKITSETVDLAIKSLKNRDLGLYSAVVKKEEESDLLNLKIDDDCFRITALQQPVAKDLRCIATMIKISDNYERICD